MGLSGVKVFEQRPVDFDPRITVAAAYVEVGGKILLLQLSENKENPRQWGVPAGKLELAEDPENAVRRELFEETGILLEANSSVHSVGQLFIRKPGIDYVYHAFKVGLASVPQVSLSPEHIAYKWTSVEEARQLPLMDGAEEALNFYLIHG